MIRRPSAKVDQEPVIITAIQACWSALSLCGPRALRRLDWHGGPCHSNIVRKLTFCRVVEFLYRDESLVVYFYVFTVGDGEVLLFVHVCSFVCLWTCQLSGLMMPPKNGDLEWVSKRERFVIQSVRYMKINCIGLFWPTPIVGMPNAAPSQKGCLYRV